MERLQSISELRKRRNEMLEPMRNLFYFHTRRASKGNREPRWRGLQVIKTPMDMILYAEMMWECKPDWVIESGTFYGGSAMFFADMLKLTYGKGHVITIDIAPQLTEPHPMVEYIIGSSIDNEIVDRIKKIVEGEKVMVVLDSDHHTEHVKKEISIYSKIVTVGQYMVVEDSYNPNRGWWAPKKAVDWFLKSTEDFIQEKKYDDKYLLNNSTLYGWLRRIK